MELLGRQLIQILVAMDRTDLHTWRHFSILILVPKSPSMSVGPTLNAQKLEILLTDTNTSQLGFQALASLGARGLGVVHNTR